MDSLGKVNTKIDLLIIYLQLFLCIIHSELKFTDYIQAIFSALCTIHGAFCFTVKSSYFNLRKHLSDTVVNNEIGN